MISHLSPDKYFTKNELLPACIFVVHRPSAGFLFCRYYGENWRPHPLAEGNISSHRIVNQIVFRNDNIDWLTLDFILVCSIITAKEVPFLSSRLIREIWEVIGEWSYQMLQS